MKLFIVIGIFVNLLMSSASYAEKLDLDTHNSLIQKIESVIGGKDTDTMISQPTLAHRLADLYAERARLLAMEKQGQGEQINKKQITTDRQKALSIYQGILKHLNKEDKGPVLLQMAHLKKLSGNSKESIEIYESINSHPNDFDNETLAVAKIELGDFRFMKAEYNEALRFFESALKISENPRKAYSQSRLAWTHYNLGQTELGINDLTKLLTNPKFNQNKSGQLELSFQEEVSRDLATFMARQDVTENDIKTLSQLSPESVRKANLIYLALELDRTAKKRSALLVWNIIGTQNISFEDQLTRQIHITRIEYDLGQHRQLLLEIDKSLTLLKSSQCGNNEECIVARQNLRLVITSWGKAEERKPSHELIQAYRKYAAAFPDYELSYWAGRAAKKQKNYPESFQFFKTAAELISKAPREEQVAARTKQMFEGSLLGAMEAADLAGNQSMRLISFQLYLDLNPQGSQASEVKYKAAHWYYENNDYSKANEKFRVLVADSRMTASLREKSADLVLDSNVILKDERQLETDSLVFAKALPQKSAEYLAIWRKSILNQTAQILNTRGAENTALLENELKKIQSIDVKTWPADQSKMLVKNKMILSYRTKNIDMLQQSSLQFLQRKPLSVEEQNLAFNHLEWVAELKMDFHGALSWLKKVNPGPRDLPEHIFKLAFLKELVQQTPKYEYQRYIEISRDSNKKSYAAHQLIIYSHKPKVDFKKYESLLAKDPALYGSASLWVYEQTMDLSFAQRALSKVSVRNSTNGELISHNLVFNDFAFLQRQIRRTTLRGKSDHQLKRNLTQRTQFLKQIEKLANTAIAKKDTSLQLFYLGQLMLENQRLGDEIMTLPMPAGIKRKDRQQYQTQVHSLVQPYYLQAQVIQQKTLELWRQAMENEIFSDLVAISLQPSKPGARLAKMEIEKLVQSSQQVGFSKNPFGNSSDKRRKVANEAELLKNRLQKDPFNFDDLAKLKETQNHLGSGPMVAFLNNRLGEMRSRGGQN